MRYPGIKDTLMTALWSGVSPPGTGAGPGSFSMTPICRGEVHWHRTAACPWALRALSHCCQLLNAKLSRSPRLCGHLETLWNSLLQPPPRPRHLPTTGQPQYSFLSTSEGNLSKRGSEEKGFLTSYTGQKVRDSSVLWNDTAVQLFPHARPYTLTTSQVSLPTHSESTLQKVFPTHTTVNN